MSYGNLFVGILTGTIIGASLGILFAPEKGSSTRKSISKQGKKYTNALEAKYNQVVEDLDKKYETIKGKEIKITIKV